MTSRSGPSVSYRNSHGWTLDEDGDQRAASNIEATSASVSGSGEKDRGGPAVDEERIDAGRGHTGIRVSSHEVTTLAGRS